MLSFFEHLKEKSLMRQAIAAGFPDYLHQDVYRVLDLMEREASIDSGLFHTDNAVSFRLTDGQQVAVPYRIYLEDSVSAPLIGVQQIIFHCIFTRSHDGYCREKHLSALFRQEIPEWALPYLLKLADDYVAEIVQALYRNLQLQPIPALPAFCRNNLQQFLRCHDRMIGYWNEFYRLDCPHYRNYVGKNLFSECLGYQKKLEKSRISNK